MNFKLWKIQMNHCLSCDVLLTQKELSYKYSWGEPIQLCTKCLSNSCVQRIYTDDTLYEEEVDE